ncbi:MAG: hypothetical protein LBB91_10130, partial [Clostridiales bacterium]|nr:hypothetical protein [Clostridiales bacterium]
MKKRKSTWLLVGILVMAVALCLLMALNAAAAPAPLPEVGNKWLQDNMEKFPGMFDYESYQTKPVFSNDNDKVICEEVWIEVPCDVDGDGKRDLIRAQIRRPIETKEGLKTPVIAQLTPYSGQNATLSAPFGNKIDMDFPGASNPDTRHLDYLKDIRYDGPRYKDLLARNFGDLSEWGIPAARTPVSTQADAAPTANWNPTAWHAYFIPLGYSCASVTIIGSQFGEGFLTYGDYAENLSAAALVDWLNGRLPGYTSPTSLIKVEPPSWATGDVAMSGTSYGGTLPFAAAVTGVKGLKTIIPFAPPTSSYEYYRANGAVYAPGGWQGEDVSEIIAYCFGRGWVASSPTLPTPAIWNRFWEYLEENYQAQDSISGDYSKWWDGRNQVSFMEDIKELNPDLGIISFHGYNDDNVKFKNSAMMFKMAEKLGITVKGIFHQGMHTSPHNHNGLNFYPQIHKWFDHYLYGVENGMPGDFPNVRVQSNLDISWMESDTWPLGQYKNLYPIPGGMNGRVGSLRNSPPNVAVIIESKFKDDLAVRLTRPAFNLPTPPAHVPNYSENAAKYGGHVNPQMASAQYYRWRNLLLGGEDVTTAWTTPWTAPAGISYDLTKPVDDRLLFTMDVSEDMRISGTIKMTAQIKADKNVGFVSAMLVDYGSERRYGSGTTNTGTVVLPNGANLNLVSWSQNANATPARIISRGSVDIQNPNYDRKIWSDCPDTNFIPNYYFQTTAIEPGKYYSYTWELDVMDYTVLKGHKLGLLIYGTDPEYTTRPFNPTEFTIRLDAGVSYLSLPIVPAGPEKPVTIEAADVMAKPGDEVDVTYKIKDNAFGFTAMDLLVPYDSSIYAPIAIKPAAGLATPFFVANPSYQSGLMRIAFAAGENAEGDGLLFTVTYKVAATAPGTGDFPLELAEVKMQS